MTVTLQHNDTAGCLGTKQRSCIRVDHDVLSGTTTVDAVLSLPHQNRYAMHIKLQDYGQLSKCANFIRNGIRQEMT